MRNNCSCNHLFIIEFSCSIFVKLLRNCQLIISPPFLVQAFSKDHYDKLLVDFMRENKENIPYNLPHYFCYILPNRQDLQMFFNSMSMKTVSL